MADVAAELLSAALAQQGYAVSANALRMALVRAGVSVSVSPAAAVGAHLAAHRALADKAG